MKKLLVLPVLLSAVLVACAVGLAQEATPYADSSSVFSQLDKNSNGTTTQLIMHAPAGDVLAMYVGRAPRQMYTKQDELLIVVSGHGTANVGYPAYELKPGSVLSIPRNSAFQITANGRSLIKAYLIATPYDNPGNKRVLEP